ncbi:MAG: hypothetical protein OJF50_002918 [Nitrospira sp.]|nr:hypothetical protein [Nitrospira sp.]
MMSRLLCALGFEILLFLQRFQHIDSYIISSVRSMETPSNITPPSPLFDTIGRIAFRHFPQEGPFNTHRMRDYGIAAFTFFSVAISSLLEMSASVERQQLLGAFAWMFLGALLLGENRETKAQVVIAVLFATIGEHFASIYMGGYTYRFENVPAYVPPGHGMVYLTAVALARSGLFVRHPGKIAIFVVGVWGTWSLWGISGYPDRGDWVGALLFSIFLVWLIIGRSPMVYLAAFFITTWLELIGTTVGAWKWAAIDPLLGWPQGNPPSGVGAWYCLVDAVAIGGAGPVLYGMKRLRNWSKSFGSLK